MLMAAVVDGVVMGSGTAATKSVAKDTAAQEALDALGCSV